MKARELQLSLEVGITGVFATGSDAYQDGWHDWQRYLALGAPLTALFIDEPITNGSRLSGLSYSTIVQETVNRIVLVSGPRDVIAIRPREKLFKDGSFLGAVHAMGSRLVTRETAERGIHRYHRVPPGTETEPALVLRARLLAWSGDSRHRHW